MPGHPWRLQTGPLVHYWPLTLLLHSSLWEPLSPYYQELWVNYRKKLYYPWALKFIVQRLDLLLSLVTITKNGYVFTPYPIMALILPGSRSGHILEEFGIVLIWRLTSVISIIQYLLFYMHIYRCPHQKGFAGSFLSSIQWYVSAKDFWSFIINLSFTVGLFLILISLFRFIRHLSFVCVLWPVTSVSLL